MRERLVHRQAFEEFVRLGPNRSYKKLAEVLPQSRATLGRWGKLLGWEDRIKASRDKERDKVVTTRSVRDDSDHVREVETLMGRIQSMLDSCFVRTKGSNKLTPAFTIKTAADFARLVSIQMDLVSLHRELVKVDSKGKDGGLKKLADTLTINLQGMSDEQKLSFLRGDTDPVAGGDTDAAGSISEADYTEVPDGADQEED